MNMKLSRAILFAKDATQLSAFYRDVLGLQELPSEHPPEEWRAFGTGGSELALHRIPAPWNADVEIDDPPTVRHSSPHKLVFVVDDVAKARDDLVGRGVKPLDHGRLNPPGELLRCDFVDPEGNVFQLAVS